MAWQDGRHFGVEFIAAQADAAGDAPADAS
jgi:hypothetical protein